MAAGAGSPPLVKDPLSARAPRESSLSSGPVGGRPGRVRSLGVKGSQRPKLFLKIPAHISTELYCPAPIDYLPDGENAPSLHSFHESFGDDPEANEHPITGAASTVAQTETRPDLVEQVQHTAHSTTTFQDSGYASNSMPASRTVYQKGAPHNEAVGPDGSNEHKGTFAKIPEVQEAQPETDSRFGLYSAPTIYAASDTSSLPSVVSRSYVDDLAALLLRRIDKSSMDKEGLNHVLHALPNLLRSFALRIRRSEESQARRDMAVFIHRYRQ